jgi:hypothetical protein
MEIDRQASNPVMSSIMKLRDNDVTMEKGLSYPEGAPQVQGLKLDEKELLCEYVHDTILSKDGAILQFVNHNGTDAATVIGGLRLQLEDCRKIPAYLAKYKAQVRLYAVQCLKRHLIETQCSAGATEILIAEDFGMSFMVASLSETGRNLHPNGRNEGPLFYCLCPGLIEPVTLWANDDGTTNEAIIVNVYIHLLDANRRRSAIIRKAKEDREKAKNIQSGPQPSGQAKKPRINTALKQKPGHSIQAAASSITEEVRRQLSTPPPPPPFPALPGAAPLRWPPAHQLPLMPDDI